MTSPKASDVPAVDWNRLLDGKVAVVTGGRGRDRRRGLAALRAARSAGRDGRDRPREGRKRTGRDRSRGRQRAHPQRDVREEDDVARLREAVLAEHGARRRAGQQRGDYRPLVPFRKSGPESLGRHVSRQPAPRVPGDARLSRPHDRVGRGLDRELPLGRGHAGLPGRTGVRGHEGRGGAFHHQLGREPGAQRHPRERHRHRSVSDPAGRLHRWLGRARASVAVLGSGGPAGMARGPGARRAFSGLRSVELRHRTQYSGRRRDPGPAGAGSTRPMRGAL